MLAFGSRSALRLLAAALVIATLSTAAITASAQIVFTENFDDAMLADNAMVNEHVTIESGIARFVDPAATVDPARATFSVVQNLTDPVMTFSFDIVEPIVDIANSMEVVLRAGVGMDHNTLQNADQVVEAIVFRGGNRGAYINNGNEAIFLVANNQNAPLTFTSPIDGTDVMLAAYQYIPYVLNKDTDMFGQIKGISNFNGGARPFERFGIGSSSNADEGTFAIDNVLVRSGVSFEQNIGPPPVLGDTDGDGIGGEFPDDFEPIRANFRLSVTSRMQGDLVSDGVVDFRDYREWKGVFLAQGGSLADVDLSLLTSVPEPGTIDLVLLAALLAAAKRNSRVRAIRRRNITPSEGRANP